MEKIFHEFFVTQLHSCFAMLCLKPASFALPLRPGWEKDHEDR